MTTINSRAMCRHYFTEHDGAYHEAHVDRLITDVIRGCGMRRDETRPDRALLAAYDQATQGVVEHLKRKMVEVWNADAIYR